MGGMVDKVVRLPESAVDPSESAPEQNKPESAGVSNPVLSRHKPETDTDLTDDGRLLTDDSVGWALHGGNGFTGRARRVLLGYGDNVN